MSEELIKDKNIQHLPGIFFEQSKTLNENPLFWAKKEKNWDGMTWSEVASKVNKLSALLISLGIKKGDRVLIASENRPEWAIADLAIMTIGAIVVPAYTSNTEEDNAYLLNHSKAKLAITSGGKVASRLCLAADTIKTIKNIILIEDKTKNYEVSGCSVLSWTEELKKVDEIENINKLLSKIDPEDTCCFIYTSGTGGRPKGVMLTHKSIISNIKACDHVIKDIEIEEKIFLSLLPLSHAYEHTCGLHWPINLGAEIFYSESTEAVAQNLQEVKPTLMIAVPRLYEVLYSRIINGVKAKGGITEWLFMNAVKLGRKKLSNQSLKPHEKILDRVLERLVRNKVRLRLGGRLKYFVSGGAALSEEIGSFFLGLGVGILQGYGQTEASPLISVNLPEKIKIDTVGPAVHGVEIKIDKFGELLVKGDLVMKGYWNDEAATNEAIKKGWLHTGDLVELDEDNYIKITGRKKEIIVNSGGDNIAPSRVEGILAIENEIEQVMVYGDACPWLSAVVVPSEELKASLDNNQTKISSRIMEAIERANSSLSQIERVRRFVIAEEPFTVDNLQMTPTMKVRRHVVTGIYQKKLLALYPKN